MSWAEKAKKNQDKKQDKIIIETKRVEEIIHNPYSILNLKDIEDEFDYKYLDKMTDISIEFRDYISNNYLPFMDKRININYDIYDLIKDHSYEYKKVVKYVKEYNENLIKDYEKEMEEINKEIEEEENLSD